MLGKSSDILPLLGTSFAPNRQELSKHNGKMYIFLAQTGFIYQMSEPEGDSVVFSRIDKTININYNISCTNFIYKDQIFNYGGYGFWNKYGHVRKFNKTDKEWDIQPTNIEVFSADDYDWFSPTEGRLYVPFQKMENKALKDPKFKDAGFEYSSYYLDIKTFDWVKVGKLSNELIKLINEKSNYGHIPHDNGRFFIINDEAYLFDYSHNKIYRSKKADLNQFFIRNSGDVTIFFYKGTYYKYQPEAQNFVTWEIHSDDLQLLNETLIYPNPTSSDLYWNKNIIFDEIIVYNLKGQVVLNVKKSENNSLKIGKWKTNKCHLVLFNLCHVNSALVQHNANEVHGIIGADILAKGKAIIDYNKNVLYLKKKKK